MLVGLNKSTWKAIHLRTRCKETFVNGQTRQSKGNVTASPRAKAKVKVRSQRKHPGKGNHNQVQAESPNEDVQRTLGDFGIKRQRVEFVGDVQENADFESPRLDRAAYVFCVQKCKSVMMDSTELPSSSTRVSDGSEEPAGTHEKFVQSTGEVLFAVGCRDDRPFVYSGGVVSMCPVGYATSVPSEKVQYSMNLKCVGWISETLRHQAKCSFHKQIWQQHEGQFWRVILIVHRGCGNGSMIVFTPDGKGKIVNDKKRIEQVKQIMASTPGLEIVYDRGAYVLDVDVNDGVNVNDERRQFEHRFWSQFSCHSQRVLRTSFEPSTARPWTTARNSTRCPWWESTHIWAGQGKGANKALRLVWPGGWWQVQRREEEKDDRLLPHQIRRLRLTVKKATDEISDIRHVNLGIFPCVITTRLNPDAHYGDKCRFRHYEAEEKTSEKVSWNVEGVYTIGLCISRFLSEKICSTWTRKIGNKRLMSVAFVSL